MLTAMLPAAHALFVVGSIAGVARLRFRRPVVAVILALSAVLNLIELARWFPWTTPTP